MAKEWFGECEIERMTTPVSKRLVAAILRGRTQQALEI